jgi:hypothetical protein
MTSCRESLDILQKMRKNFLKENKKCIHRVLFIKVGMSLSADGGKGGGNISYSLRVILKTEFMSHRQEGNKYPFSAGASGG